MSRPLGRSRGPRPRVEPHFAYHAGEPTEAIVNARSALSYGGLGDVAKRRLLAIQARALGHLGDVESAQRAIRQSEETGLGHRDDLHDGVGGEFSFPDERLAMSNRTTIARTASPTARRAPNGRRKARGRPSVR